MHFMDVWCFYIARMRMHSVIKTEGVKPNEQMQQSSIETKIILSCFDHIAVSEVLYH